VPTSIEGKAVVSIGAIFAGNTTIKSVQIPSSVTSIGERAFSGCSSLISVTIPSSVTSIGEMAFSGCRSLTSVTIPSSVTSIGYEAFSGCSRLTKINCKAASQPSGWKKNLYNSWKANCNATVVWGYTGA
ncbi:MAG: leucine-rich repeat domain-containing protein, partial [Clostridia bacterium]